MRLTTLGSKDGLSVAHATPPELATELFTKASSFAFSEALELIWKEIKALNKEIDDFEPWKKLPPERSTFLTIGLQKIQQIAYLLQPFMPGTAAIIMEVTSGTIRKCPPLFPKKQ
jgi:methionyl-tRNA synthetase